MLVSVKQKYFPFVLKHLQRAVCKPQIVWQAVPQTEHITAINHPNYNSYVRRHRSLPAQLCCYNHTQMRSFFRELKPVTFCASVFCMFLQPMSVCNGVSFLSFLQVFILRCRKFGCQYQCNFLPSKTHLQNDLLCVEWDNHLVRQHSCNHMILTLRNAAELPCAEVADSNMH